MRMTRLEAEERNKKRGFYTSSLLHLCVALLFVFPFCQLPYPPPGQEGIVVSFGNPMEGMGDIQPTSEDASPESSADAASPPIADASTSSSSSSSSSAKSDPEPQKRETSRPEVKKEVVTNDKADTPAIKKDKKKKDDAAQKAKEKADKEAKEKADQARKQQEEADRKAREAKEKAEAEARAKAAAEKAKADAKKKFGFPGSNQNGGQGNTNTPGDQGSNDGDPNAENLEGDKSPGKGKDGIGIDLVGRSPINRPSVKENSNKVGDVRVEICVNPQGKVVEANFSIRGSTTQDSKLVQLSEKKAREFTFDANENAPDPQCGSITFKYRVE